MSTTTAQSDDGEDGRRRVFGMEAGIHEGTNSNPGRLWAMDQRIDKPLGVEADQVRSMYLNQVRIPPPSLQNSSFGACR